MNKVTLPLLAIMFIMVSSCSPEQLETDVGLDVSLDLDPNFRVIENTSKNIAGSTHRSTIEESCLGVNLIAGQHHIAGTVTVDIDGENLIITYTTNGDWTIEATHLSIGNCAEQTIPTTGSGNPKVGHFEHSSDHNDGVNEVVYMLNASVLDDNYCFAAHAEVSGPTGGETAWAEGEEFPGNNWAMYVDALLSDCIEDDSPPVQF